MPDPAWPSSPPEANHLRLAGPGAAGSATTLASGAAWQALMAANEAAFAVSSLNTAATAAGFAGVGGTSSATAATGLNTALQLLAGWAQEKPPITASAVGAYEAAVSTMIPAEVALANRAEQAADVALNPLVLGALTPAIVALDMVYFGEYWPHNASAGAAYGATLAALIAALAVPPPLSPPGGSAAAPAGAAAALAQAAGRTTGEALLRSGDVAESASAPAESGVQAAASATSSLASAAAQPVQAALGAAQPVSGMFGSPMQALGGITGLPPSMLAALGGIPVPLPDAVVGAPMPAGVPGTGAPAGIAGAGSVGPAVGAAGVGSPAVSGNPAGLTSYTRPNTAFAAETAGRPAALRTGLLSAAELRGPTATGISAMGGTAVPVPPAQSGMLGRGRGADGGPDSGPEGKTHARIVIGKRPVS